MLKSPKRSLTTSLYAICAASVVISCGDKDTETQEGADDVRVEDTGSDGKATPLSIAPGTGIGPVRVGMTYAELQALVPQPTSQMGFNRMVIGSWTDLGLDVVFASSEETQISDDAVVVAAGAKAPGSFKGAVLPGMSRSDVVAALGESEEAVEEYVYYEVGLSVQYAADEQTVEAVGIFSPYELEPNPPKMIKSGEKR